MLVRLHKNARTTPAIRAELRNSPLSERKLAAQYGLTRATVRKWKNREDVSDRSHRPHKLRTTLTPAQEAIVVELRRTLLLPLDDLLVITREFINAVASRSALDLATPAWVVQLAPTAHGGGHRQARRLVQPKNLS